MAKHFYVKVRVILPDSFYSVWSKVYLHVSYSIVPKLLKHVCTSKQKRIVVIFPDHEYLCCRDWSESLNAKDENQITYLCKKLVISLLLLRNKGSFRVQRDV